MTNKDAYLNDLDDLRKAIDDLLGMIPVGKNKKELQVRNLAESVASSARATVACMRNDYHIVEQ